MEEFYPVNGEPRSLCVDCHKENERSYREEKREQLNRKKLLLRAERKAKVLIHYGGNSPKCNCCGESEIEFLAIDHIDGGGTKERKIVGEGADFFLYLESNGYPDGFQILCHNCNRTKGIFGYCPHEKQGGEAM